MINLLEISFILAWPFGQLLSFYLPPLGFSLPLLDLLALFLFLLSLTSQNRRKQYFSNPVLKSFVIFACVCCLSLLLNLSILGQRDALLALYYLVRLLAYSAIFFIDTTSSKIKKTLTISFAILIILSLGQYLLLPDVRFLKNIGFDDHYYRLVGSLFDPNFLGVIISLASLFALAKNRYYIFGGLSMLLALTFSRASFLGFGISFLYLVFQKKNYKLLGLILLLILGIILSPKPFGEGVNLLRTFSIVSRFQSVQQGIGLFIEKPFFGWGFNTLSKTAGVSIDNSLVFVMATTGIIGFLTFLNFLLYSAKACKTIAQKTILLCLVISMLMNNTFFYIWIIPVFWLNLYNSKAKG